jgi:hypothetical protein
MFHQTSHREMVVSISAGPTFASGNEGVVIDSGPSTSALVAEIKLVGMVVEKLTRIIQFMQRIDH